jgi:uncharacterized membrane protein YccC
VGESVRDIQTLETPDGPTEPAGKREAPAAAKPGPLVPVLGRFRLPPTTVLAFQAMVSAGLAMSLSAALHLDHPWWAFWSAFVVIAGASGESRRKLGMRVAGTIAGGVVGTLIAVIAPDTVAVVLGLVAFAMAMAIYMRPASYTWMVFWIVVFMAMLFEAGGELDLILVERPINVAIGAVIAFIVVTYILPIPLASRFLAALAGFLAATDRYLGALVAAALSRTESPSLDEVQDGAMRSFEVLAQTFPSVDFDFYPFAEAQSPLTALTTAAAGLHTDADRLAALINTEAPPIGTEAARVIGAVQSRIHDNFAVVQGQLSGKPAGPVRSLTDLASTSGLEALTHSGGDAAEAAIYARRLLDGLARIQQSLVRLSDDLRAQAAPARPPSLRMTPSDRNT